MVDATPQLKRKREGAGAQHKKVKKQRKVDAQLTSASQSSPDSKNKSKAAKQVPQTNGIPEDVLSSARSISSKEATEQEQEDASSGHEVQDTTADVPNTSTVKQQVMDEKKNSTADKKTKQGGKHAHKSKKENKSVQPTMQIQQSDKAAKKEKKKRVQKDRKSKSKTKAIESAESAASSDVDADEILAQTLAKTKKSKRRAPTKWTISPAQGGWFLPNDPIFSIDEKYLIFANLKSLQVYAAETSSLVNAFPVHGSNVLTAYALSSSNPNQAYVADSKGHVTLWDWVEGAKIERWNVEGTVRTMVVITRPESNEDFVYCHVVGEAHTINIYALRKTPQGPQTEVKGALEASSSIRGFQVLSQGKYLIAWCTDSILVAKRLKISKTALSDFEYVWRELKFSTRITACNAYLRQLEATGKGKKSAQTARDVLDIAVGDDGGVIFLLEDVLPTFAAIESDPKGNKTKTDDVEVFRPKRLHWHREAVGSVKWSLDGNYLISGGDETVLTIWQLATGKPQHLPHLTAAIENIVVSPSGSAYAVTLANNSVIVLSTTELQAKTNIVGIQSRRVDYERLLKESKRDKNNLNTLDPVPMAINPQRPNEVLFTVPSSQPRYKIEGLRPEPYLQTFDLANHRAKSRQALTRNNATDINLAPEGGRVLEPSVKLLQVSHDGQWLATVDEWIPPHADTNFLDEGIPDFNNEERLQRREVFLKIWRHDEQGQWKLDARIDAPHFFEHVCANGRVFDLAADPTTPGFATIGDDHIVRIWRPKTRLRDGLVVRGAEEQGLVTWSLERFIELSDKFDVLEESQQPLQPRTSRLAFSADGSLLAAALSWAPESDTGITHIIDTNTATIRRSITEIDVTALAGLGVVGRHLVAVSDSITVWDLVLDQLVHSVPIKTPGVDRFERMSLVRLATNEADGTFSVALPRFEKKESESTKPKKASSRLSIFDPKHSDAQWTYSIPSITLALVSRQGERGYVILDSTSCIKTISPGAVQLQLPTPPPEEKAQLKRAAYIEESDGEEQSSQNLSRLLLQDELSEDLETEKPVINQQALQEVLDNSSAPLPPQRLFSAVLALVGRPPKVMV